MTDVSSQNAQLSELKTQINNLTKLQYTMNEHMTTLSKNYHSVVQDLLNFQKTMNAQDQLMQSLVQYLIHLDTGLYSTATRYIIY